MLRFRMGIANRAGLARAALLVLTLILAFFSSGCLFRRKAKVTRRAPPPTYPIPRPSPTRTPPTPAPIIQGEEGLASWYGHPYHGRRAANGEIYNMHDMTAAHRTLSFRTQVRVYNLENGRSTVVRINDRGPFIEGRIIDLSYASAQVLGIVGPGTARVRLEILGLEPREALEPGIYAVQVGAFLDRNNAERLKQTIAAQFGPVTIESYDRGDGLFHRVRVGRESSEESARELARRLREAGFAEQALVVRLN